MKRTGLFLIALLLLVSGVFAKQTIVLTNSLGINRNAELVEISLKALKVSFAAKTYVLKNVQNKEVGYQLIYNAAHKPVSIIFQADVKANGSVVYTLTEGKPTPVDAKTFARFVPERKDDFAWENDMAAYRMYGPALANENPSNGVDYWAKCTGRLVVDQRYKDDIYNGISYHIDHGLGLDFYKVAHTLGCGGIAPYASGSLWVGNHFDGYKVVQVGPLRSVFSLTYDSVKVGNVFYKEVLTITTNAGSLLNKAEVQYIGKDQNMELAVGIYLHDIKGNLKVSVANGTSAYAENAISDAGIPAGRNYAGVYVPVKINTSLEKQDHALLLANYEVGKTFTYYFGAGWSKWHYPTDEDWFKAVHQFALKTKIPLKISIK